MALADDLKPIVFSIRAIPGQFGLRPHTVAVRDTSWDGPHTGDGEPTETWTSITESGGHPPKVRWLRDDEVAVGGLASGTVEVGPITPELGVPILLLQGDALSAGDTHQLLITGPNHPNGAIYAIKRIECDRALHYKIQAAPVSALQAAPVIIPPDPPPVLVDTPFISVDGSGYVEVDVSGFIVFHAQ